MRDDTTSTDRTPSAAFDDSDVCEDSWMHVPSTPGNGITGSKAWGLCSFMAASVPTPAIPHHMHSKQGDTLL